MKKNILFVQIFILLFAASGFAAIPKSDVDNSSDHPIVSRFKNSHIIHYEKFDFNEYILPLGKSIQTEDGKKHENTQSIEGKVTRITYFAKPGSSTHEIFRSYERELKTKGFKILFSCMKGDCGPKWERTTYFLNELNLNPNGDIGGGLKSGKTKNQRFLVGKLERAEGDIYLALYITGGWWKNAAYQMDIIESQPMSSGQVKVSPKADLEEIDKKGHIAIYGINFDSGKSEIKNGSSKAIMKIAKILNLDPSLNIYVVGHTDDMGGFQQNMDLSRSRAKAIVNVLVKQHNINPSRLEPHGAGPLVPTATNGTPEGRALNRRVDLVKTMQRTISKNVSVSRDNPVGYPDVKGLEIKQAVAKLKKQGFTNIFTQKASTAPVTVGANGTIPGFDIKLPASLTANMNKSRKSSPVSVVTKQEPVPPQSISGKTKITLTTVLVKQNTVHSKPEVKPQVEITSSPDKDFIIVPSVIGKRKINAKNILKRLGFRVRVTGKKIGKVISQSPKSNSRVKPGSGVLLKIGK